MTVDRVDILPANLAKLCQMAMQLSNALETNGLLRTAEAGEKLEAVRLHLDAAIKAIDIEKADLTPAVKPKDSPDPDHPVNTPTRVPRG